MPPQPLGHSQARDSRRNQSATVSPLAVRDTAARAIGAGDCVGRIAAGHQPDRDQRRPGLQLQVPLC